MNFHEKEHVKKQLDAFRFPSVLLPFALTLRDAALVHIGVQFDAAISINRILNGELAYSPTQVHTRSHRTERGKENIVVCVLVAFLCRVLSLALAI